MAGPFSHWGYKYLNGPQSERKNVLAFFHFNWANNEESVGRLRHKGVKEKRYWWSRHRESYSRLGHTTQHNTQPISDLQSFFLFSLWDTFSSIDRRRRRRRRRKNYTRAPVDVPLGTPRLETANSDIYTIDTYFVSVYLKENWTMEKQLQAICERERERIPFFFLF